MFKLVFKKAEEPEIKLPTSGGSSTKQESSRKTSTSASLSTLKPVALWIITNSGKFLEIGIADYLTHLLRNLYAGQEAIEPDMEQGTGSKLGKEYFKAIYYHPAYLTYLWSTSCEMPGWMKHKLELRLLREILITSDMQITSPLWQKAKNERASY